MQVQVQEQVTAGNVSEVILDILARSILSSGMTPFDPPSPRTAPATVNDINELDVDLDELEAGAESPSPPISNLAIRPEIASQLTPPWRCRLVLEVYAPRVSGRKGSGNYHKVQGGSMRFLARDMEDMMASWEMVKAMVNGEEG